MILGVQILGIVFGFSMAYICFLHYKRREFGKAQFLFWEMLWLSFIIVILFPKITNIFLQELSIPRAFDFFVVLGFLFVIFLTFYNYTAINKMKGNLERKIREESLKGLDGTSLK
ncbi:MAG: DUF2304 domain-containing protein [bacterium]|nr:DUF2304 domain-containing protein [bacterium]